MESNDRNQPRLVHIYVARSMCYCHIPLDGGLDHLVRRLILLRGYGLQFWAELSFNCWWGIKVTKLFVDTNIYLDFYRGAQDRLSLFEELKRLKDNLIISEQGYREFQRNRTSQLLNLAAEVKRTSSISIFTTAVVRDMVEHQEATRLQSEVRELGKKLKSKIDAMLEPKPGDDPVLDAYENLTKSCTFMKTKEELIAKAKNTENFRKSANFT
ncbi:hypothetical protein DND90_05410 [Pseudomonas syringae pv. maculicola]|nr:hypothetical protein DND90_05410 [Pseudomonas syringae pv. maculicola]